MQNSSQKASSLQSIQNEKRRFAPSKSSVSPLLSLEKYEALYARSLEDSDAFWLEQAETLEWIQKPTIACKWLWDKEQASHSWFSDGIINISINCLDRHLKTKGHKIALTWQGEEDAKQQVLTYSELHEKVCKLASALKSLAIQKGDRVAIYLPMIPEAVIAMLACARIGAVHTVVFGGFSAEALAYRLSDTQSKLLITADQAGRGGKIIPFKAIADEALAQNSSVEHVIVVSHENILCSMQQGRDHYYDSLAQDAPSFCDAEPMAAEDPLFILYTSGSTGKPKGIVHSQAGYLLQASLTHKQIFDLKDDDLYFCTADVGWVTGHSYIVYGPLANSASILLFEGTPTYPDAGRLWQVIDKYRVTILYTAPTVIRTLMHYGDSFLKSYDLSSLRLLATVGEPINPEAWIWFYEVIGKACCPVIDTWWQTETGGIMIAPFAFCHTLKPGSASRPFFGVEPAILRSDSSPCLEGEGGNLCIKKPWPGIMRGIWNDPKRFFDSYFSAFPGSYFTGDGAKCDEEGDYWLLGRIDDVVNVSGHRLGTAEIESAFVSHQAVAEAAVIPIDHEIKGQALYAYIILLKEIAADDSIIDILKKHIRQQIGAIAIPDQIFIVEALPKTRSGKIMRRILRKIANNQIDELGDISTLAEEHIIKALIDLHHF